MKNTGNNTPHDTAWYERRVEYLSGFMSGERFANMKDVLDRRTRYMTVCTENLFHPQNASALIRHCDAFGLQDIHAVEHLCRFRPNVNIVRGTDKWIDIHRHPTTSDAMDSLKAAGYRIIATTPHEGDVRPEDFDVSAGPFAIVLGTEHAGVSDEVRARADGFLSIPMQGFVESLNVSACAAIIIYMLSEKLREQVPHWGLSEEEKPRILYEWMAGSVRESKKILARFEQENPNDGNSQE